MARYLLDTGVVIRHLRGRSEVVTLMRGLGKAERLGVATITRLEVHAGMRPEERYRTRKLLSRLISYDLDREIADRAGDLVREHRARGIALEVPDAIIAATAMANNLTLVTLNPRHFPMPGLKVYSP